MLANDFLMTSDLFAALFFLAAVWALWSLLHRVSAWTFALSCFTLAGLLLSKYSGVLIIPMGLILLVIRLLNPEPLPIVLRRRHEASGRFSQLLVFLVAALWANSVRRRRHLGFLRLSLRGLQSPARRRAPLASPLERGAKEFSPHRTAVVQFARDYHLLPEGYIYGFSYTLLFAQERNAFLNGVFSQEGWISFFPYCLAVKTPIPLFLLLALAGWAYWAYRHRLPPTTGGRPLGCDGPGCTSRPRCWCCSRCIGPLPCRPT